MRTFLFFVLTFTSLHVASVLRVTKAQGARPRRPPGHISFPGAGPTQGPGFLQSSAGGAKKALPCSVRCYINCLTSHQPPCNVSSVICPCPSNETIGAVPSLPVLDIINVRPLKISWTTPFEEHEENVVYLLQRRIPRDPTWQTLDLVNNTEYKINVPNGQPCQKDRYYRQMYRLAAISPAGTFGFSTPLVINSTLMRPGKVRELVWNGPFTYQPGQTLNDQGYFVAHLTWNKPEGWVEESIDTYTFSHRIKHCLPGSFATPIFSKKSKNELSIKLADSTRGCIYVIKISAVSRCDGGHIVGESTNITMDLRDCSQIQGYTCPTTQAPKPIPLRTGVQVSPVNSKYTSFLVNWTQAHIQTEVERYALQWGIMSKEFFFGFSDFKEVLDNIIVPRDSPSLIINITDPSHQYGVRIIPLLYGQNVDSRDWLYATIHTFPMYPNPIEPALDPNNDQQFPISPWPAPQSPSSDNHTAQGSVHSTDGGVVQSDIEPQEKTGNDAPENLAPVMSPIVIVVVLVTVLASLVIYKKRSQRRKQEVNAIDENFNYYKSVVAKEKNPLYPSCSLLDDVWEIPFDSLTFGDNLGQGAFGIVREAVYKSATGEFTVAVKMLLDHASDNQKQEFLQEIDIMKRLGHHAHIVSMTGCCTLNVENPLCVVVEHMNNGDLVHYLRCHRPSHNGAEATLSLQDLYSFARQIAIGMEFLSQKGYVHRDLAARNVLVDNNKSVKIGDFGLTRYIYDDKVYVNRKGGKLPLKWMSLEAIFDLLFTSASDVWSYGVLLFELITLGGTPYPTFANGDLLRALKAGYRMEQPDACPDLLYTVMFDCWSENPTKRPTFTELRDIFDEFLQSCCHSNYLDLSSDQHKDYYRIRGSSESIDSSLLDAASQVDIVRDPAFKDVIVPIGAAECAGEDVRLETTANEPTISKENNFVLVTTKL